MSDYNEKMVPILAPGGFPVWTGIPCGEMPTETMIRRAQTIAGVKSDGMCGPATVAAIARYDKECIVGPKVPGIVVGAKWIPLPGFKVKTYLDDFTLAETTSQVRDIKPTLAVLHYDVTFSAESTHRVLKARGLSTHFCIDGDGTIIQHHDPASRRCSHAGSTADRVSFGVDVNNVAEVKHRKRDGGRWGKERDIHRLRVHGSPVDLLGYFPEQIRALKALLWAVCPELGVRIRYPVSPSGGPLMSLFPEAREWNGIVGHHHLTERKIDPGPLPWDELLA